MYYRILKFASYRLSRKIEKSPRLISVYRKFCFFFLKPKDHKQIPIYINNRNRYTYLVDLIDWFDNNGYTNYYVIDNDSTYPPLIDYYKEKLKNKVIYLGKNCGHLSIWTEYVYLKSPFSFYVYTDSDILPEIQKNSDLFKNLLFWFEKVPYTLKVGSALNISDLPDTYIHKNQVIKWEEKFWKKSIDVDVYQAPVDTTLGIHLPFWNGYSYESWKYHIRVAGSSLIRHQPWYEDSSRIDEEQSFYLSTAQTSTHWTSKSPN